MSMPLTDLLSTDDVLTMFEESGALLKGHFVLTSGRHSDQYFEKFDVLAQPKHVEKLCIDLAARVRSSGIAVDVVLGPTTLGIVLAYELAKQLGVRAAYAEKSAAGSAIPRMLRRPAHLEAGDRVLIVDDVLTTGGSIRECLQLADDRAAVPVGVAVLVDRSGGGTPFGALPTVASLSLAVQSWAADEVPAWLAEIPVSRPGSTGKK